MRAGMAVRGRKEYLFLFFVQNDFHHLVGCFGNRRTGTEDSCYACLLKEVVVLCGNHTAGNDHDVLAAQFLQFVYHLRDECLVAGGQ